MYWNFIEGRIFRIPSHFSGPRLTEEEENEHWRQAFLFRDWLQGKLTNKQYEKQSGKKIPWDNKCT